MKLCPVFYAHVMPSEFPLTRYLRIQIGWVSGAFECAIVFITSDTAGRFPTVPLELPHRDSALTPAPMPCPHGSHTPHGKR